MVIKEKAMKISVKVIPGAKKNLWKEEAGEIKVYLTAPPVDNKANVALVKFVAKQYNVKTSAVTILQGLKSRKKIISIT